LVIKLQLIINPSGLPYCDAFNTASKHNSQYLKCLDGIQLTKDELIANGNYLSKAHQLQIYESYIIQLKTPHLTSEYTMHIDQKDGNM